MAATLPTVAYIAGHRLFVQRPDQPCEQIESTFAEQILEREAEHRQRQAWRGGRPLWQSWQSMSGADQLSAIPPSDDVRPIVFTSVARAAVPGEMLYIMQIGRLGGLLHYKLNEDYERRLVHRQNYEVAEICVHPVHDLMVCSVQYDDGSCNLAKADREGRHLVEITGGDSRDESASWVAGNSQCVVYQSAGVGRNAQGVRAGLGPYRIMLLDLESQSISTLRQDDGFDFLNPRRSEAGDVYYIRRPYNPVTDSVGLLTHVSDAVLFPFRLARAFVHFFNAFSQIFSGKPLYTAGGPRQTGPNVARLLLWGRLIDAEKSQPRMTALQGRPLVPANWELCVQRADGQEESVLASHIVSYDLCDDGGVVYTTGTRIFHRAPDGAETLLGEARLIHKVAVVG